MTVLKYPIIILEGPDCSGKTTLADKLIKKYKNAVYIHNAVSDDILSLHTRAWLNAFNLSENFVVIIDRLHLSEEIYGNLFRHRISYDTDTFDKKISGIKNVYKVLCLTDKETTLKLHAERKGSEMFDNISKVWDAYSKVENWKKYDWQKDEFNLEDYEA